MFLNDLIQPRSEVSLLSKCFPILICIVEYWDLSNSITFWASGLKDPGWDLHTSLDLYKAHELEYKLNQCKGL